MSSIRPAPPPPPPPPVSQAGQNSFTFRDKTGDKLGKVSNNAGEDESLPAGHTETREITTENFLREVSDLVTNRMEERKFGDSREYLNDGQKEVDFVKLVVTTPIKAAILQNGPMCGIVALTEAIKITNPEVAINTEEILQEAIKLGFSKQGEMFSIKAMNVLAETFSNCKDSRVLSTADTDHFPNIVSHVFQGHPVLFPYDADYNHSPSLRKGHAAHWAVIYGIACIVPSEITESLMKRSSQLFKVLSSSPELLIIQPSYDSNVNPDFSEITKEFQNALKEESLYVLAHQGKSYHIALWKYNELLKSNQNLKEVSPKILENKSEFICNDIIEGLCSKILLLK